MPFTASHAAAALPFRRSPLILSAIVLGTFAPDFEYFLFFAPIGHFGHTLPGAFLLDLPLTLILFWLFHRVVRRPATALLPTPIRQRLPGEPNPYYLTNPRALALVLTSALLGIATHILWDSFTHTNTFPYNHLPILQCSLPIPILGNIHLYKLLQHLSTLIGLLLVAFALRTWFLTTSPNPNPPAPTPHRHLILFTLLAISTAVALTRAYLGAGLPIHRSTFATFLAEAAITFISLTWWLLVLYGLLTPRPRRSPS